MFEALRDVEELEACVGPRPPATLLKSISYLDDHCRALLAASPFAVAGIVAGDGSVVTGAIGGPSGVLAVTGRTELALPLPDHLDVPAGAPVGLLVFVPGYRETLRVNGRLGRDGASLQVEEAFLHCAKALIRSRLWEPAAPGPEAALPEGPVRLDSPGVAAFLDACPFVALASCDDDGGADVSPKGDPPGAVVRILDDRTLAIADRPGNHRTDTMHNLLARDRLGLLAVVPGSEVVLHARGRAAVTGDEAVTSALAVQGKVPTAAIVLTVDHAEVRREAAIGAAQLWDPARHVDRASLPKATQVWVDHVQRSDDQSELATTVRSLVDVEGLDVGIAEDYRTNLY